MIALSALGQQFRTTKASTLPSDTVLPRVLTEQCELGTDRKGQPTVQAKPAAESPWDSVQQPADSEASDNAHRGQGYAGQILETYAEDDACPSGSRA
jgi:hypothetical protein